jgi:3-isopropylmalate dehydrogenase
VYRIAVIEGDGIGPEVVSASLKVLNRLVAKHNLGIELNRVEAGDDALRRYGEALPARYWPVIRNSHAILKGPVGETAGEVVVRLRRGLDLYANVRPVRNYPGVRCVRDNVDLVIVRENTEDVYIRAEHMLDEDTAVAMKLVTRRASERIARVAMRIAMGRRRRVTIVHKANVLTISDGFFRKIALDVAKEFPGISVEEEYIDSAVMDLVRRPWDFDVILTMNLYGDILSDLAAYVTGSIGLAPSANLGDSVGMFEPVHGSAPDIAGKGVANPTAMMLSMAWMLEWIGERYGDHGFREAGREARDAVMSTLSEGKRLTPDLGGGATTLEFTESVLSRI